VDSKQTAILIAAVLAVLILIVVVVKTVHQPGPTEEPKGTPLNPEDAAKFGGQGAINPTRTGGANQ